MSALSEQTVSIDEVAAALGTTAKRLKRTYRSLYERYGFPPPLPGGNWVWGRRAVSRWIDGPTTIVPGANDNAAAAGNGMGDLIGAQNGYLRQRYGQGSPS